MSKPKKKPDPVGVDEADPAQFDEAVRAFRERVPMTDLEFDELMEPLHQRAFTVSGVAQADMVQQVFDALDASIAEGTSFDDFKEQVGGTLEEAWGGEVPGRLETIFRTNVQTAYSHGRVREMRRVKKSRPYARFDGIDDDAQTDICDSLDGQVMSLDEIEAQHLVPPLHFNCRTILTPLTRDEAEDEGIDDDPDYEAEDGFGKPPDREDAWEPDLNGYDPRISEILAKRLDDE